MSKVAELYGYSPCMPDVDWGKVVAEQKCPFGEKSCYKVRKSDPDVSIGTCSVIYGKTPEPIIICPRRLLERRQIFTDCLHLMTNHEPGNELHLLSEVSVPGGSIDFVLVSVREGRAKDFVGIELQTLDTTGTVWPERQRLLKTLGIHRADNGENSRKPFGMNWKMTAKTILVQIHHKLQTFEHVNRRLVLVIQDRFLDYMINEFKFEHVKSPATLGDSLHIHAYRMNASPNGAYRLVMSSRSSTDVEGIATCLGLQADARIELAQIHSTLEARISTETLFRPI